MLLYFGAVDECFRNCFNFLGQTQADNDKMARVCLQIFIAILQLQIHGLGAEVQEESSGNPQHIRDLLIGGRVIQSPEI